MEELTEISLRERIRLNLVFAMGKAKISQVNLADKLGISKGTVNNWVRGNNSPDVDMVPKICKVLNITIRDFYSENSTASHESQDERSIKTAPPYSDEAMQLAQDYDEKLDTWGQKQVRDVADNEILRCKAEKQKEREKAKQARAAALQEQKRQMEAAEEIAPEVVEMLVYMNPAAAGTPLYAESDFERLEFPADDVPRGADFGIRISGKSMEPTVMEGAIVWVRKRLDFLNGTVGVFMLNDSAVCKRFFKEGDKVRLESDNPDFGPVPVTEFDTFVPVGEVIGTI